MAFWRFRMVSDRVISGIPISGGGGALWRPGFTSSFFLFSLGIVESRGRHDTALRDCWCVWGFGKPSLLCRETSLCQGRVSNQTGVFFISSRLLGNGEAWTKPTENYITCPQRSCLADNCSLRVASNLGIIESHANSIPSFQNRRHIYFSESEPWQVLTLEPAVSVHERDWLT